MSASPSEPTETVSVEVSVPESSAETPPASPAVVVVEDNADTGNSDASHSVDVDHESRLTRIEVALEAVLAKLEATAATAESALAMEDVVIQEVGQVREELAEVAEEQQAPPEADEEPAREHWFYRGLRK